MEESIEKQDYSFENKIEILQKRQKLFKILLIALALYFLASLPMFYYLINTRQSREEDNETEIVQDISYEPERKFVVKGTNLVEITGSGEEVIFANVEGVEKARLGPDETTLHFKVTANEQNQYCALLTDSVDPDPYPLLSLFESPSPIIPPWDYNRLGSAYTISHCGENGRTGGFLKETGHFVFVEERSPNEFYLVIIQNKDDKKTTSLKLDSKIVNKENNFFWINGHTNQLNDYTYYYPQADSEYTEDILVIAVGRMIVAVDISQNKLLGNLSLMEPDYNVTANAFSFISEEDSPLILIQSFWEGYRQFQALLDFGGEELKVVPLYPYDQGLIGFNVARVKWEDKNSVVFSFYKRIDITDEIDFNIANLDNLESQLKATGKYIDVYCTATAISGCFAITNTEVDKYRYTPNEGLVKL